MLSKDLTETDRQFILDHAGQLSHREIARRIGCSHSMVSRVIYSANAVEKRKRRSRKAPKPLSPLDQFLAEQRAKIKRPPAIYSNRTRDEVISYYLSLPDPS